MGNTQNLLYQKAKKEFDRFNADLKNHDAEYVMGKAYELVIKEEILSCLECDNISSDNAKILFKQKEPLESIYQEWLKNDYSIVESIKDTIDDKASRLFRIENRDKQER